MGEQRRRRYNTHKKIVIKSKEIQDNEPDFNYLFFHTH